MKNLPGQSKPVGYLLLSLTICFSFFPFYSCTKDFLVVENKVIPNETLPIVTTSPVWDSFLFRYDKNEGTYFRTDYAGSSFGGMIDAGHNLVDWIDGADFYLAGVQVKGRQFITINGNVTGWSPKFSGPATGNISYGGGTTVGDINKNGIMDMLLMTVDNPYGKD
jgi:hypothetical protein